MDALTFQTITDEQIRRVGAVLKAKNAQYNPGADELQTFKTAAALQGISPKEALGGMMIKHTVSIYDMIGSSNTFPIEVWEEKATDHMVYLAILMALVREEQGEEIITIDVEEPEFKSNVRFAGYSSTATEPVDTTTQA